MCNTGGASMLSPFAPARSACNHPHSAFAACFSSSLVLSSFFPRLGGQLSCVTTPLRLSPQALSHTQVLLLLPCWRETHDFLVPSRLTWYFYICSPLFFINKLQPLRYQCPLSTVCAVASRQWPEDAAGPCFTPFPSVTAFWFPVGSYGLLHAGARVNKPQTEDGKAHTVESKSRYRQGYLIVGIFIFD